MSDKPYCTCGTTKPRQEGFTKVGEDWVCAVCRKATLMYTENVIIPRLLKGRNG